jgi:hypothetical protein
MLVLIFAAGSFLVFIAVLACLFVAHTLESREVTRKRNVWTNRPARLLSITQAFEPVYAPLWEAPIAALQLVNSAKSGIAANRLQPIFRRASAAFPEIYDGCEFLGWLQFLEGEDLLRWDAEKNRVTISEKGKEFLANRFVTDALLAPRPL